MTTQRKLTKGAALLAIAFGLLTIMSGGTALFGAVDMGAVVPFVLWFNFLAGFAYVAGGILLWKGSRWSFLVALAILLATVMTFAAFGWSAASGTPFEMRTVVAMTLRTGFWAAVCFVARRPLASMS
jgi:hypothetical protein